MRRLRRTTPRHRAKAVVHRLRELIFLQLRELIFLQLRELIFLFLILANSEQ